VDTGTRQRNDYEKKGEQVRYDTLPLVGETMDLIYLAVVFMVLALVAFILGAKGVAGFSMQIAKWLIIIFIVLAVVVFLFGGRVL
jgi:uncharacterized membrane protein YtjA (UPF0391 family)